MELEDPDEIRRTAWAGLYCVLAWTLAGGREQRYHDLADRRG